jgi:hypothetical protein
MKIFGDLNTPFKGRIEDWRPVECNKGLGYYIVGRFLDHPQFAGQRGHTSYVVDSFTLLNECIICIETRNSRYNLVMEWKKVRP